MKNLKLILPVFIVLFVIALYFTFSQNNQTQISSPEAFPLNDSEARYYLEKLNTSYVLTYAKNGTAPKSIYISSDTTIVLDEYLGKDLIVEGKFQEETRDVQCVQAPCDPISNTVIHVTQLRPKQ